MEKAIGYARVSMEKENIQNQIIAIKEYAKERGYHLVDIIEDIDVSGAEPALKRPGFQKLLQAAELLNIKTIILFDLTRLGRDLFDVVSTYKLLLEKGYNIIFVKHPELNVVGGSPIAEALRRAILALLGIVAEFERAMIRERTIQGLERARKQGKHIGRPPFPFPVSEVRRLLRQGYSIAEAHRLLTLQGKICIDRNGKKECMKYETFRRKVKMLCVH
jgi:putative DNA-invertase from lambdoid prophage Rac